MAGNDAKFRDRTRDKYGIVLMRRITCDEWPHIKYFSSLIILLELIDVSQLILTLNDAKFHCRFSERSRFLKILLKQNDLVNKLHSFTFEPLKGQSRTSPRANCVHDSCFKTRPVSRWVGLSRLSCNRKVVFFVAFN